MHGWSIMGLSSASAPPLAQRCPRNGGGGLRPAAYINIVTDDLTTSLFFPLQLQVPLLHYLNLLKMSDLSVPQTMKALVVQEVLSDFFRESRDLSNDIDSSRVKLRRWWRFLFQPLTKTRFSLKCIQLLRTLLTGSVRPN